MSKIKDMLIQEQENQEAMEGLSTYGAMCTLADKVAFELYEQVNGSAKQVLTVDMSQTYVDFVDLVYDRLSSKYVL